MYCGSNGISLPRFLNNFLGTKYMSDTVDPEIVPVAETEGPQLGTLQAEEDPREAERAALIEQCRAAYPNLDLWVIEGAVEMYLQGTLQTHLEEQST